MVAVPVLQSMLHLLPELILLLPLAGVGAYPNTWEMGLYFAADLFGFEAIKGYYDAH